jgi:hypothetical protein
VAALPGLMLGHPQELISICVSRLKGPTPTTPRLANDAAQVPFEDGKTKKQQKEKRNEYGFDASAHV